MGNEKEDGIFDERGSRMTREEKGTWSPGTSWVSGPVGRVQVEVGVSPPGREECRNYWWRDRC